MISGFSTSGAITKYTEMTNARTGMKIGTYKKFCKVVNTATDIKIGPTKQQI